MRERELVSLDAFLTQFKADRLPHGTKRKEAPANLMELNHRINTEELTETEDAIKAGDMVKVADGVGDVLYTLAHATQQLGRVPNAGRDSAALVLLARAKTAVTMALKPDINMTGDEDTDRGIAFAEIIIRGIAAVYDLPLEKLFDEIHSSNMSKLWPGGEVRKDEGGKVIKPPTYTPAAIEAVIQTHREQ